MSTLSPKALARWAWLPGMAALDHKGKRWRICAGEGGHLYAAGEPSGYIGGWLLTAPLVGATPDFSDKLTALSLPAVVRMAWASEAATWDIDDMYCRPNGRGGWIVIVWTTDGDRKQSFDGATTTEAWLKALEVVP